MAACTPPTDIVSTNTEDTGNYHVVSSAVHDDTLEADVCVDIPRRADEVAARIVHQLANHGYSRIVLNVASPGEPIARYVASGASRQREPAAAPNPCGGPRPG